MNKLRSILKRIKLKHILGIFIFIILLPISLIYKLFNKITNRELWLICEEEDKARCNGYHFFKYMMENKRNEKIYYAIDKKCSDYKKIAKYSDNIIEYGSIKHYFIYMSASKNIVSQKSANPNPPLFYVLHVILKVYNNRIFIQHGIIINECESLLYKKTHFKYITATTKTEYDYLIEKYGYPKDKVLLTGLARFDNLNNDDLNNKQIVIMPSWRNNISGISSKIDFTETSYYINWIKLLNDPVLLNYIENKNITIYFYPHQNMEKYIKEFKSKSKNVKIVDSKKIDIQKLINESALMVTDYSSVSLDFAYLNKPVIYYQFDVNSVRKLQYKEGYYKYDFGYTSVDYRSIVKKIIESANNKFKNENEYTKKIEKFFSFKDNNNCKRIYDKIR